MPAGPHVRLWIDHLVSGSDRRHYSVASRSHTVHPSLAATWGSVLSCELGCTSKHYLQLKNLECWFLERPWCNTTPSLRLGILIQFMIGIVITISGCQQVHMYDFESTTLFLDPIDDIIQLLHDHIRSIPVLLLLGAVSFLVSWVVQPNIISSWKTWTVGF